MRSRTWRRCSVYAAPLTPSSCPIRPRSSPDHGSAAKSQGSIDLTPWRSQELRNASEMPPPPSATDTGIAASWNELRAIAGAEHLHSAGTEDSVAGVQPQAVFEPDSEKELAEILRGADAAGLGVVPRGGASKIGWGNP